MRMDDSMKFWMKVIKDWIIFLRRNTFLWWGASDTNRKSAWISWSRSSPVPGFCALTRNWKCWWTFSGREVLYCRIWTQVGSSVYPHQFHSLALTPTPLFSSSLYCESGKWENYQRQMLPLMSRLVSVLIQLDAITTSLLQLNNETTVVIFRWTLIQWKTVQNPYLLFRDFLTAQSNI